MKGMTLIELIIVAFIISTLAAIGYLGLQEFVYRGQISQAVGDICRIEMRLQRHFAENVAFPATLAEIGENNRLDPWGNPYQYWPITGDKNQKVRKDKNLHPINTDFDLCSMGRDGNTNFARLPRPAKMISFGRMMASLWVWHPSIDQAGDT